MKIPMIRRVLAIAGACTFVAGLQLSLGAASISASAPAVSDELQTQAAVRQVKDFWIKTKIHSKFAVEDELEGSNIDVDIERGAVTLNGVVASDAARAKAESIAKDTDGVKSLKNNLTVGPAEKLIDPQRIREAGRTAGRTITDGWVKSTLYARYAIEASLEDSDIDVDIKRGAVTLQGTVKTEAGRARALEIARGTAGVVSVKDELKIG